MHSKFGVARSILVLVAIGVAGCGNSGPSFYPVKGKVTLNGEPLKSANVMFQPDNGPPATGTTNDSGEYTLTTGGKPGAIAGNHKVSISAAESSGGDANMTPDDYAKAGAMPTVEVKSLIPEKYGNVAQSGLTASVTNAADKNTFDFDLKPN